MAKNNKKQKGPNGAAIKAPKFDESALSALTDSLEKQFSGAKNSKSQEVSSTTSNGESKKSKAKKSKSQPESSTNSKKRDSQGNVKASKSDKGSGLVDREVLLKEILSMGGTEEDLDLIGDADSEDDDGDSVGGKQSLDATFAKELSKFVTGLGIETQEPAEEEEDIEEEEEEEEEAVILDDDDEEIDENSWEDDSADEKPIAAPAPSKKDAKKDDRRSGEGSKDPNRLVFEARPDWHAAPLNDLPSPDTSELASYHETIAELNKYAVTLLEADGALYASKHLSSTSSHRFLATIMTSGTLSDKVSALTLVVQESPVHTVKSFTSLLELSKKRSRGQAVSALGALKDLLGAGVVLPANRRLREFRVQPGLLGTLQNEASRNWRLGDKLPGDITRAHLISWAFEDWLKKSYFDMLKVLESWCNDEVEFARQRAVTYVYELLRDKPEQESNLLRLLVNKLGDPEKKIASRTSYLILQLQTTHPNMKPIIIKSIETELLLRPNQGTHARYYAINTLNQTILSTKEEEVAKKLLHIYFDLFVNLLKKPDIAKLTAGPVINKKGQLQGGGGQKGKKAQEKADKEVLAKLASEETTEKMISAVLTGVNRAFPFGGSDDSTLEKHMDMLFKITHSSNFNTSIQALILIQQLATEKNLSVERFYRTLYESLLDPRLITSSKHALFLNLLFRALKADLNVKRVKAFAKRLVQTITLHQPSFVCGVLYMLRELEQTFPNLTVMFTEPEEQDDDEEVFKDVPEDDEAEEAPVVRIEPTIHPDRVIKPEVNRKDVYDGRKRDPEHSQADKSCLWELIPFLAHFHPSVSLFAHKLMEGTEMPPKPDLASHTLIHFLDRFVYRNAKAASGGLRGSSIMQPLAGGESQGVLVSNRVAKQDQSVNTEAFWRKKAEDVAVDEVFFHNYFSQIGKSKSAPKKAKKDVKDGDSEAEDEAEDEIWNALVTSRPDVEGPSDDDDSDLEMLDLESEEDSDAEIDDDVDVESDGPEGEDDDEEQDENGSDSDGGVLFDEDEDDLVDEDELFNKELEKAQPEAEEPEKKETSRSRKKKMKALPTFASADDYAAMLEQDDGEDV